MVSESIFIAEVISIACTLIVSFQILRFLFKLIYNFITVTFRVNAVNLSDVGKWAIVTGATDGIGKAFAEYLAKQKKNIILISRNEIKLEQVARELQTKYKVQTKVIVANFTYTEHIYHDIDKQLQDVDIGILINNVGMSYSYPEYFLDVKGKDEIFNNIINCNIFSITNMCKIVMPRMVKKRQGIVINVASTAAQIPSPLLTVYAASKSYVVKFSEDLSAEYSRHGIVVQCLLPGYVATNMSKIRSSTWMAPSPKKYVEEAMTMVGVKEKTTGYYPHTILVAIVQALDSISPKFSRLVITRTMCNIRARALRRAIQ